MKFYISHHKQNISQAQAPTENKSQTLGVICVLASTFLFGCMPLFTMLAYRFGSNPETAVFARCLSSSIILALVIAFSPKLSFRLTRQQFLDVIAIAFAFVSTIEFLFASYPLIGTALATVLHFTYPIAVIVIIALFYRERPTFMKVFCAALCIVGLLCFYTPGDVTTSSGSGKVLGMAIALISGVFFALYIVLTGRSHLNDIPVIVISFWVSVFCTIMAGIFSSFSGNLLLNLGYQAWLAHVALGFFISSVATPLLQKGIFLCGEVKSSLLSNFEPIVATFIGVFVFHEALTLRTGIGMVCILVAAILTSRT